VPTAAEWLVIGGQIHCMQSELDQQPEADVEL
jgi:hypothetical protein